MWIRQASLWCGIIDWDQEGCVGSQCDEAEAEDGVKKVTLKRWQSRDWIT